MDERLNAEENLRVIRQLMERVTVYRAISAPTALVGGILALLAAGAVYYNNEVQLVLGRAVRPRELAVLWMVVLLLAWVSRSAGTASGTRSRPGPGADEWLLMSAPPNERCSSSRSWRKRFTRRGVWP